MPYKNKDQKREYQRQWVARNREEWLEENGPCVECGSRLDLHVDHKDATTKVTHRVWSWSWSRERREKELSKCQVLCSACHKDKTRQQGDRLNSSQVILTPDDVQEIRQRLEEGDRNRKALAEEYGVHPTTISHIKSGKNWKYI